MKHGKRFQEKLCFYWLFQRFPNRVTIKYQFVSMAYYFYLFIFCSKFMPILAYAWHHHRSKVVRWSRQFEIFHPKKTDPMGWHFLILKWMIFEWFLNDFCNTFEWFLQYFCNSWMIFALLLQWFWMIFALFLQYFCKSQKFWMIFEWFLHYFCNDFAMPLKFWMIFEWFLQCFWYL